MCLRQSQHRSNARAGVPEQQAGIISYTSQLCGATRLEYHILDSVRMPLSAQKGIWVISQQAPSIPCALKCGVGILLWSEHVYQTAKRALYAQYSLCMMRVL